MFPDLAVTLSQRRWSCVVDPALLLLTPFGPTLVQRLGELMELWMVRTFWRVLDDSVFCLRNPERLAPGQAVRGRGGFDADTVRHAVVAWERIRARSDLCGLRVRYVGDTYSQSALPEKKEPDLVQRFEALSEALLERLSQRGHGAPEDGYDAWAATLDVLALGAALSPAFVLTFQTPAADQPPALCAQAQSWGLRCLRVNHQTERDPLATLERDHIRSLLVHAGLAPLAWAGVRLAVAHVLVPGSALVRTLLDDMVAREDPEVESIIRATEANVSLGTSSAAGIDFWHDAQVFWYSL